MARVRHGYHHSHAGAFRREIRLDETKASAATAPIPAAAMASLVAELLREGRRVSLVVGGSSMAPFVRGGDLATLEPAREASLGQVVIRLCGPERLLLHRVVARPGVEPLTRGDATHEPDPPLAAGELLGRLSRIERQGRRVRLGLGPERLLLAWLSGRGWLRPPLVALRRALGASGEGGGAAPV